MRITRRRSNIEVICEMLRLGENGAGKTEIMYSANMSYAQLQKYLGFLLSQGLVNKLSNGNPIPTYHLTEKGLRLLRSIEVVLKALDWGEDE